MNSQTQRDLEDFARLWVAGLPTFPANENWAVRLSWEGAFPPTIRLYYAADRDPGSGQRDGGARYLRDTAAAADQLAGNNASQWSTATPGFSPWQVAPGQAVNLPLSLFDNAQTQFFLFTAVKPGTGNLTLSVLKDGDVVTSTSVAMD